MNSAMYYNISNLVIAQKTAGINIATTFFSVVGCTALLSLFGCRMLWHLKEYAMRPIQASGMRLHHIG